MAELKQENSYSSVLKRMSAFGGVQVFNVLINLIRGKFVALILGPDGMGITSLFTTSTGTLQQLSGLGLNLAIVKEVAANKDDKTKTSQIIALALRLILFTSVLGAVACVFLSPLLSYWSFGNYEYTLSFIFLSLGVALFVAGAGYLSLLQGLGEVKRFSRASIVGGLTGLFGGVPMYYFWGTKGIVPAIVLLSFTTFLFYYFNLKKSFELDGCKLILSEHKPRIKKLISLGLILMVSSVAASAINYIINIFIRYYGSIEDVGLFQAANSITSQYVGFIFSAMALDYFPRLSAIIKDLPKMNEVVNRQSEIVIVVMTPIALLLFISAPWLIKILLADSFLQVTTLVKWLGLGVLLQGVSFPLGYLYIANENKKLYFWTEIVVANLIWIACSFTFYYFFSLNGLGISLVVRTAFDILIGILICGKFYGFKYKAKTLRVLAICLILGIGGFLISLLSFEVAIIWLPIVILLSLLYTIYTLITGSRS